MNNLLTNIQILLSILVIALVLMQARGTGFSRSSATSFTRRGLERLTFKLTIILVAAFIAVSIIRLIV